MVFGNPIALWILPVVLLILIFGFWGWRVKKNIIRMFKLDIDRGRKTQIKKYILAGAMLTSLILALALPQLPVLLSEGPGKTGLIVFMVDASGSMAAKKNLDSPNRLERVKPILYEIIEKFPGAEFYPFHFTNTARSLTPPITKEDFLYLKKSIARVLDVYSAPGRGSSIGQSLLGVLDKIPLDRKTKIIVLLSDGETFNYWYDWFWYDLGGLQEGLETLDEIEKVFLGEVIQKAIQENVKIITVGVGEKEGATIPLYDEKGEFTGEYAQHQGRVHVTYLKEEILREIARQTGGRYFFENDYRGIINFLGENLVSGIEKEKRDFQDISYLFLIPVIVLWIIFARYYFK